MVVEVTLRKKLVKGVIYSHCEKPKFKCEKVLNITDYFFSKDYLKIIKFISEYYSCSIGEGANLFIPFLKDQKIIQTNIKTDIKLSKKQNRAYEFISLHNTSLLFADTGSGKTEIYMKLFEKVINEGKSAILLMPEISLTPQIQMRLKEKFGDLVALWHSKITKKKKEKILHNIYKGEIKIIAGARSALFLPLLDIGAIVVDEEHDSSYKASNRPRYSAKDLAIYFGKILGAKVLLGSATPSLNSYIKFSHFRLKGTYYKSSRKILFEDHKSEITPFIKEQLNQSFTKDKQAIIFLPTRANFKYISCSNCGAFIECPYCSVGMSLHTNKRALKCHYCNFTTSIPKECPECKSGDLQASRIGTAEVIKELQDSFRDRVFAKFDKDSITTQTKLKKILKEFNDKKIDVLVGTQMLSKGHDYHDIDLAIILGIDHILSMSDFMAREKALSLALQVAGRSGRRGEGRVVIQTQNIEFFKKYLSDYELFLKDEINFRKDLYPPYKKLMRILISNRYEKKAKEMMQEVVNTLNGLHDIEIVGYGEAEILKIASKFRYHVLLRSSSSKALLKAGYICRQKGCEIDIDPISFS